MTTATAPATTRWNAVVAVALATVLAAADMSIVAVALPDISAEFTAPPATTQWVMLVYLVPMVSLGIPVGRWLDRAQARASFVLATMGFGVASVLIMISPSLWALLAGRGIQGIFAAVIGVMGFPIVATAVRPEHRARAMSIILTLLPLSAVAGPVLGGLLTEAFGWRSVFAINVPIVAVALWVGLRAIPAVPSAGRTLPMPDRNLWGETLVLGIAVTALLISLDMLGRNPASIMVPAVFAAVAVTAAAAWVRHPMSRSVVTLVRHPQIALPVTGLVLMTTTMGATYFLVPFFVADVLGRTPAISGLILLVLAAGMAITSPVAGVIADRYSPSPVLVAGGVVTVVGMLGLALLSADPHPVDLAWRLGVIGIGQGLYAGPNAAVILAATPPAMTGTSGGVTALFRTLGFALGPAIGALVWSLSASGGAAFRAGSVTLVLVTAGALAVTIAKSGNGGRLSEDREGVA